MKQFIKYCLRFLLPLTIVAVFFEIALRKIPNDYQYKNTYLNQHSNELEVLFLGSSHIFYGINPDYIRCRSFNAAHVSQTLDLDYKILISHENNWKSLKYIVIPVDYFSFYSQLAQTAEDWRLKNYIIYDGIYSSFNPNYYSELSSNNMHDNIERYKKYYFHSTSDITCNSLGWGNNYQSNHGKNLDTTGKFAARSHLAKNNELFEENVSILGNIIAFAKAKNIAIILISCPAYYTYTQNLNTSQYQKTKETAIQLCNAYSRCHYYNFFEDARFLNTDFYDANHLNEIGARKFSLQLDSIIKLKENQFN